MSVLEVNGVADGREETIERIGARQAVAQCFGVESEVLALDVAVAVGIDQREIDKMGYRACMEAVGGGEVEALIVGKTPGVARREVGDYAPGYDIDIARRGIDAPGGVGKGRGY